MMKPRSVLTFVVATYMVVLFGYGLVKYPDAPIHPCVSADYCGKRGQPHTEQEYRQFLTWQSTLAWTWIPGMLVLYVLNRNKLRRRRVP